MEDILVLLNNIYLIHFNHIEKAGVVQEFLDRRILQAKRLYIGERKAILALALESLNINDIEVRILK
ncbi:unnamed protein product [Rotaria sordida]|uniref:Uncharacterized protein n=1 Tax=Rotaria sordida TaxID=392033 RepID=A0A814SBH8_9BILA|nr:unnamed protein product [Rotaria sordida]CAF1160980.1 unnamed protein product [Rotaria sordida]CAF1379451.1 unnamed protein product [Rotaria sordida]CAF3671733.1 unnamed protein product [Rotaria sordida]